MPRLYSSGRDILFESSARGGRGEDSGRHSHQAQPPNAGLHGMYGYFLRRTSDVENVEKETI
jgi:hypothetical protein